MRCSPTAHHQTSTWHSGASHYPATAAGPIITTQCVDPAEVPTQQRTLTTGDVLSAIRRIGLPAAKVNGPAFTLVNLNTTFSTQPHTIDRTLNIIGYHVDLHIQPTRYTWTWGDGTTTTTTTPGNPYPATDITHTYHHATNPNQHLNLSVQVDYHARYRVDGQNWIDLDDPLTINGPTHPLPIKQASAVLVQPSE